VIDAHVHLWDQTRFDYPWLKDEPGLPETVLPADLRDGGPAIRDFVFVQADCRSDQGMEEARWVEALASESPEVRGIVAFAPLEDPTVGSHLDELGDLRLVVGVRRLLQDESTDFIRSDELASGVRRLGERGWTFDACIRWQQLPALLHLAQRTPEVSVILDHLGKPPVAHPTQFDAWKQALSDVAALPNTAVKLSGLPAEAPAGTISRAYHPWLRAAVDLFGAERSMVGTDWPVSRRPGLTRDRWFEVVSEALEPSPSDRDRISQGTAVEVYDLRRAAGQSL
jgi:L-fuconolactonase